MNTETLRETLHRHAGDAPPSAGLLDAVRARSHRRRRNRQLSAAGAAVVAVALAIAGPAVWVRATAGEPLIPPQPASSQPAEPTPQPTGATALVPAPGFDLPDFPFTPGWTPPGLSEAYYSYQDFNVHSDEPPEGLTDHAIRLFHLDPEHGWVSFSVTVRQADPRSMLDKMIQQSDDFDEDEPGAEPSQPLSEQAVTIRGRDAVLLSNDRSGVASWQHGPAQWVVVQGGSADDVLRYAEELVEQPFAGRTPFTFDLLPAGAALNMTGPDSMAFEPLELTAGTGGAVEVALLRGNPGMPLNCPLSSEVSPEDVLDSGECPLPREPVQVGEREAELVGSEMVVVYLDGGLALTVAAAGTLSLSQEDLIRFAAGVQLTPDARSVSE